MGGLSSLTGFHDLSHLVQEGGVSLLPSGDVGDHNLPQPHGDGGDRCQHRQQGERVDDGRTTRVVIGHEGVTTLMAMTTPMAAVAAVAASGVDGKGVHGCDSNGCHVFNKSVY